MSGWVAIIVFSYVISIPVAIWAMSFMPGRGTLSPGFEKQRRNGIFIGFLPCGLLSLLFQALTIGTYYARVKSQENRSARLTQDWNTSSGRTGAANPFGTSGSGGTPPPVPPRGNPFSGESSDDNPPRRDNPFA